jgi:nucleoside-diphosphate-sugar epimerase
MQSAHDIVTQDLNDICQRLSPELAEIGDGKLLITGGAGFLGHYLVQVVDHWNRQFAGSSKIELTVFDNLIRGLPPWLAAIQARGGVELVVHDIAKPLPADMTDDYAWIIHAATIASPTYYRKHPIETMDANINGLRQLLDYLLDQQERGLTPKGFLFYSSSEVYGDPEPEAIPTREDYYGRVSFTGPRACYDESKRYGETLCVNFARVHDLPLKIARPFNNYGPGLKITDRRVLPDFARNVLAGEDIVMLSDGSPTRTFCYVADAVVGYFKVLVKGGNGEAYNIGTETPEISMAELARRVVAVGKDLFDYRGSVKLAASEESAYLVDNPNRRCPRIDKARSELGYEPQVGIDEGLRRALIWYKENAEGTEA